jgi:hypothetical protein
MKIIRIAPRLTDPDAAVRVFCARTLKLPAAVELVYAPFVLFRYAVEMTRFRGEKKAYEGLFLADLIQGGPMNVPRGTRFEVGPGLEDEFSRLIPHVEGSENGRTSVIRLETGRVSEAQVLPALMEREGAMARGKKLLRYDLMRLAGGLRHRRLDITLLPGEQIIYYPLWLVYYRRRGGEVAFRVVDAVTGRREGGDLARSIAMGLVGKRPAGQAPEFSQGAHPR